tara:strand:- start:168 stop:782 length:615 start_codon:yes stop_codon:yes gene_type:complete
MALIKVQSEGINLADDFTFTGTVAGAGGGSMVLLAETTCSGVTSVDMNGYFTSDYDVYKFYLDGITVSVNGRYLALQFNTTGSYTTQTSSYYSASPMAYTGASADITYIATNNGTHIRLMDDNSSTTSRSATIDLTIYNPLSASYTKGTTYIFQGGEGSVERTRNGAGGGMWNSTTAATGVRFMNDQGSNISIRKIRMYGIKNS